MYTDCWCEAELSRRKAKRQKQIGLEKYILGGKTEWTSLVHFERAFFDAI